ncbi:MAG: TRAP transporter small permease [Phaeodactylibacter sp.]|nr:TRAP transporter small permease [Phaeodactylibacter sp.]MCB9266778.1 TRAP transporter small permease [Lewinellaceae bacterium]MCB9287228.1 TRAP transporter small permease [Lewinellaceae bacterium]
MRQRIDKILGGFLAFLMALMTLDVLWGVFTRYAMGSQASWSEELARFLLIWIGILGAAYAAGKNMHLAIDLLRPRLNNSGQKRLYLLISSLIIIFAFVVMVVGGIRLIYITQVLGQLSPALRIPMAVVYSVVPLSGLLVIYYKADNMSRYDQEQMQQ